MMNVIFGLLPFIFLLTFGFSDVRPDSVIGFFQRGFSSEISYLPGGEVPYRDAARDLPEAEEQAIEEAEVERKTPQSSAHPAQTSRPTPEPENDTPTGSIGKIKEQAPMFVAALETIAQTSVQIKDVLFDDDDELLSVSQILQLTNKERAAAGLSALTYNRALAQMAQIKASDMIAQNYFDHISPQGVGVGELAGQVGYAYLLVGENLALGDFRDNEHVVDSWMESPGHRANLMHEKFSEIGIAVLQGEYNGKKTWVAVQEFGLPRAVCPFPNQTLKASIDSTSGQLAVLQQEIANLRSQFEAMSPSSSEYDAAYATLNSLISNYNAMVAKQKSDVAAYNGSVKTYNMCIEQKS